MDDRIPTFVRFGDFEADLETGELRRSGIRVRLPEQAFQVLAMLLSHPGQLVTREALQQKVWPADTFVDFDRGLNKAVNRVREALGDSAEEPRLVETLPKRGYRFIGTIEPASRVASGADSAPASEPSKPWTPRLWLWVVGLGVCGFAIALFAWRSHVHTAPQPLLRSALLAPRGTSFQPNNFAISSDGSQLVFSAVNPDGTDSLWLRSLSGVAVRQLEGTAGGSLPFWSPDNKSVGFFADRQLKTIDLASGALASLCPAPRPFGGSWNVAGQIVFVPDVAGPLQLVDVRGGPPQALGSGANRGYAGAAWPHFLPDGRHFLYTDRRSSIRGKDAYIGSLDGSPPAPLVTDVAGSVGYAAGHVLFARGGSLVEQPFSADELRTTGSPVIVAERELTSFPDALPSGFAVSTGGVLVYQSYPEFATQITRVDRNGQEAGHLARTGDSDPAVSPNGRLLATSCDEQRAGRSSICVTDLERGVTSHLTNGQRDRFPTWSSDGRTLAYLDTGGDPPRIYQVAVDGTSPPRPLPNATGIPTSWSPNGDLLLFGADRGNVSLSIYKSTNGTVTPLGPGSEGQFSPDGQWILFGGQEGIIVQRPTAGGEKIQVAAYGGRSLAGGVMDGRFSTS